MIPDDSVQNGAAAAGDKLQPVSRIVRISVFLAGILNTRVWSGADGDKHGTEHRAPVHLQDGSVYIALCSMRLWQRRILKKYEIMVY